jgi:hypothetical protein
MAIPKINGRYYDWASVEVSMDFINKSIISEIVEISYEEKTEMKHRYGLGLQPRGYAKGNREYTGKIVFNNEGWDELMDFARRYGYKHIDELPPININVHYLNDEGDRVITDVLEGVKFYSPKKSAKQGDTELTTEVEMIMMNIKWNA